MTTQDKVRTIKEVITLHHECSGSTPSYPIYDLFIIMKDFISEKTGNEGFDACNNITVDLLKDQQMKLDEFEGSESDKCERVKHFTALAFQSYDGCCKTHL